MYTFAIDARRESLIKPGRLKFSRQLSSKEADEVVEDLFVENLGEKTIEEIDEERFRRRNAQSDSLRRLLAGINSEKEKRSGTDRDEWVKLSGQVEVVLDDVERAEAEAKSRDVSRVAGITVGLEEGLKHDVDLQYFKNKVLALFRWYNAGEMRSYMAPYMPVIQSSGTGKTRLFVALRESAKASTSVNYDCMTVLCVPDEISDEVATKEFFDRTIHFPRRIQASGDAGKIMQREVIQGELDALLSACTKDMLVLLFDEAQHVLRDTDGAAFRCIRWWLREQRDKQVVAVFAGTTSKLANFYTDTPPTGFSRNPKTAYFNYDYYRNVGPTNLYDPLFRICTIGCFQNDLPTNDNLLVLSDFEKAAYFGRPLFAYLQKSNMLVASSEVRLTDWRIEILSSTLHGILKRLVLSESSWKNYKAAICSILGSRVQMGVMTSNVISSELVSKAYAHLVYFAPDEANENGSVVRVSFMPDPVCAALAMGLMQDDWAMALSNGNDQICGENKRFWSKQAVILLSSGLCLPEKGNVGEIMGALYMLYCGDELRHSKDRTMQTFSVPLFDWFSKMRDNSHVQSSEVGSSKIGKFFSMDVNFIQVCRNYFRADSWKTQKSLEWMYKSAVASYVYQDCEANDLVGAVRVIRDGEPTYHPLLVSVKCHVDVSRSKVKEAVQKMKKLLNETREEKVEVGGQDRKSKDVASQQDKKLLDYYQNESRDYKKCPPALCVLLLIGAREQPDLQNAKTLEDEFGSSDSSKPEGEQNKDGKKPKVNKPKVDTFDYEQLGRTDLGNFPDVDTFRLILVPTDDQFDISRAVLEMTTVHEMTEIFSSHGFVYGEDATVETRSQLLRKTRPKKPDEPANLIGSLLDEFSK